MIADKNRPNAMADTNSEQMASIAISASLLPIPPHAPWYVAYTKPRSEHGASAQLIRQGYDVYLPLYKDLQRTSDGMAVRYGPMFPRYVFFRPGSVGQSIAPVRSTRGVSHIVRFGASPATVKNELLAALRAFELQRETLGMADLSVLKAGSHVAVCAGPFKGLEGLVSGTAGKRITVLLDVLGQQTRVCIPDHQLQALAG